MAPTHAAMQNTTPITLHPKLEDILSDIEGYFLLLQEATHSGNFALIVARLDSLIATDPNMQPAHGEDSGMKYYKPFHRAAVPKIIEALRQDLPAGRIPTISLSFQEIDQARRDLGISSFGSKQDVLYGFTSERYKKWGASLNAMGFRSACMVGEAEIVITMAPRYLDLKEPDEVITEVLGGISTDFWETIGIVFGSSELNSIKDLERYLTGDELPIWPSATTTKLQAGNNLIAFLSRLAADANLSQLERRKVEFLLADLQIERAKTAPKFGRFFKADVQMSQEQIGLKYADEGKYVQKILGGKRVEHLQSNVKMVKNPLRGNKCEVDSIYRVLSEKKIVLLEAKGKDTVSRAQLYQIYETYRLKVPHDWNIAVLVLLLGKNQENTIVDLVEVSFNETLFGQVTESLCSLATKRHYRWLIRQPD